MGETQVITQSDLFLTFTLQQTQKEQSNVATVILDNRTVNNTDLASGFKQITDTSIRSGLLVTDWSTARGFPSPTDFGRAVANLEDIARGSRLPLIPIQSS
jgi:hypothetical protein